MVEEKDSNSWKWMPALVVGGLFVFSALLAVFVTYLVSPEKAKSVTAFASFFSNVATPFVTVGAVAVAYKQLMHNQERHIDELKHREEERIVHNVTDQLENISNSVTICTQNVNDITEYLEDNNLLEYIHTCPQIILEKYKNDPKTKNHITALLKSITDLKNNYEAINMLEKTSNLQLERKKETTKQSINKTTLKMHETDCFIELIMNESKKNILNIHMIIPLQNTHCQRYKKL